MIIKFLLGLVAGSADAIIALFQRLDATIETFLVQHDQDIVDLENEIAMVRADADQRIAEIRAEIADRVAKAATVLALKNSLSQDEVNSEAETAAQPDIQDAAAAPVDATTPVASADPAPAVTPVATTVAVDATLPGTPVQ